MTSGCIPAFFLLYASGLEHSLAGIPPDHRIRETSRKKNLRLVLRSSEVVPEALPGLT